MKRRVHDSRLWLLPLFLLVACGGSKTLDRGMLSCQGPATIQVVAQGLRSTDGELRVALFQASDGFPNEPLKSLQWGVASIDADQASFTFEPVECGYYAISVFHDEDGNEEMKTDFLGRPQEGWGVSNNAQGSFGPPSFEDAAFAAEDETVTVQLTLRY